MKSGGDLTDFFGTMDNLRLRLGDVGGTISHDSYENDLRDLLK